MSWGWRCGISVLERECVLHNGSGVLEGVLGICWVGTRSSRVLLDLGAQKVPLLEVFEKGGVRVEEGR